MASRQYLYGKPVSLLFLITCITLTCFQAGLSQPSVEDSRIYGGNGRDQGTVVHVMDDQSILLGGASYSDTIDVMTNQGGSDYWIMRTDPAGDILWTKSYGGSNNDRVTALGVTGSGATAAFGTTFSGNGDVGMIQGLFGAWLINLDSLGNLNWSQVISGSIGEQGVDFHITEDDEYVVLVQSASPVLFENQNNGLFDYWVAELDAFGNLQWGRFFGGNDSDIPTRIRKTPGGYLICGYSESQSGDVTLNQGGFDYWIIKVDIFGNLLWERSYGGSGDDMAYDLYEELNGDFIVVGTSDSQDGDKTQSFGEEDLWIIKCDGNGDLLWEKTYGGSGSDAGTRIVATEDNRLYVAGQTDSDDGNVTGNKGRIDYWLLQFDADGNLQSQMNYGGSQDDLVSDLWMDGTELYLYGTSASTGGNLPVPTYPETDAWLLSMTERMDSCAQNLGCFITDIAGAFMDPPTNGGILCNNSCNVGGNTGPFLSDPMCQNNTGPVSWIKIRTDQDAELMTIRVESDEFNTPRLTIVETTNCLSFDVVACATGTQGETVLIDLAVEPNQTYYALVSDVAGLSGTFDICVSVINVDFCNVESSITPISTSLGSPLEGPYQPGELVSFCYEITEWAKLDCNGLQGIVPTFGPGWDSAYLDPFGMPIFVDSMLVPIADGFWDWYKLADVRYNTDNPAAGYQSGQGLPPGWYFTNTGDPPPNSEPDETTGDIVTCADDTSTWKVCFTMGTRLDCTTEEECSVSIKTFADGEIGSFVSLACGNDAPTVFEAFLACCIDPGIAPISNFTRCSGDTVQVLLESNLPDPVMYSWEVVGDGSVLGAVPGVGTLIRQQLINVSDTVALVTYRVMAQSQFCEALPREFTVSVRPVPSAIVSLAGPSEVCSGEETALRFTLEGSPPYFITFSANGIVQDELLLQSDEAVIPVVPEINTQYRIVEYRDASCQGTIGGLALVDVLPAPQNNVFAEICVGETFEIAGRVFSVAGEYEIILENAAANGCDSSIQVVLTVNPDVEILRNETICQGESIVVGNSVYSETGMYTDTLTRANGCDSIVILDLTVVEEFVRNVEQTICFGNTVVFGDQLLGATGMYFDTIPITPQCDSILILDLTVLENIQLVETVVNPDNGSQNGSINITLTGGLPPYAYTWSNGSTNQDLVGLGTGNYMVTVTDAFGCTNAFEFFVPLNTATKDLDTQISRLEILPNPVRIHETPQVYFQNPNAEIDRITIDFFTPEGKIIGSKPLLVSPGENIHVLEGFDQVGLYFVRFRSGQYATIRKLMVF